MAIYTVFLTQKVKEEAVARLEAPSADEARRIAMERFEELEWVALEEEPEVTCEQVIEGEPEVPHTELYEKGSSITVNEDDE